ncbi:MAG: sulfatase [Planctomycetota bacterium]
MNKTHPNVLFIICDDLNNALPGMGRTPEAPAPHIASLMHEGVRFPHHYANCPICLPSRSSLFSGLYPYRTGHYTLWDDWRACVPIATTDSWNTQIYNPDRPVRPWLRDAVMMPLHFRRNGYETYGSGKTFHQGRLDDAWWTEYSGGVDYGPRHQKLDAQTHVLLEGDPLESYVHRYDGLDRFFLSDGQFRHTIELDYGPMDEIFRADRGQPFRGDGSGEPYWYENDHQRDPLPDESTADYGVDVLRRHHDRPFFLALGLTKPHTPLNAPREHFDRIDPSRLELPPLLKGDIDDCARAHVENTPYGHLLFELVTKTGESGWRRWLHAYLACIAFLDDQVGKVLQALDNSPYRDNTVVIFTSDNGYHMGEKEYIFKNTLWEEAGGIPLIMRGPGIDPHGQACQAPVSLIDLYPTLCGLCDLPQDPNTNGNGMPLDGRSLRPLLKNPQAGTREGPAVALSSVRGNTGIHHSVRDLTYRYILCQNGEEELYDHTMDPHEWHNLASDPAHASARATLRESLLGLILAGH